LSKRLRWSLRGLYMAACVSSQSGVFLAFLGLTGVYHDWGWGTRRAVEMLTKGMLVWWGVLAAGSWVWSGRELSLRWRWARHVTVVALVVPVALCLRAVVGVIVETPWGLMGK